MTPLAMRFANDLTLPKSKRTTDDRAKLMDHLGGDLHCFDVTAIAKAVHDALELENLWPDVESMAPKMFLPSPVTWLEYRMPDRAERIAWALEDLGGGWSRLSMVGDGASLFSLPVCEFRARGVLETGDRIEQRDLTDGVLNDLGLRSSTYASRISAFRSGIDVRAEMRRLQATETLIELDISRIRKDLNFADSVVERSRFINLGVATCVLMLDLINTPGLVGMRQHDPHRGLARRLASLRSGSYPLRGWSEIVLKHETRAADGEERHSGTTYHKCFHFVRSHLRHYHDGKVSVIPAHWRGDPALGIKRTRYRVAA